MKIRQGMIVTIYNDPVSEKDPEGSAVLLLRLNRNKDYGWHDGREMQRWRVKFTDDKSVENRFVLA